MEKFNNLWLEIKEILKSKYDESTFNSSFKNVDSVYKVHNNHIYLPVDNQLQKFRGYQTKGGGTWEFTSFCRQDRYSVHSFDSK